MYGTCKYGQLQTLCNATPQFLKQVHKDKFTIMKDSTSEADSKVKA